MLHSFTTNQGRGKKNLCGTALDSLLKYADGISYAHKGNVDKHVKSGGLHDWAKQKFQGNVTEQPKNVPVVEKNQRTLQDTIQASSNIASYRRLFVTVLHIAMKQKPISDFEDLIELQQNGLKFLQGKLHEKACAEFIDALADTLKKAIKFILLQVSAFSWHLMDCSLERQVQKKNCIRNVLFMGKLWNFFQNVFMQMITKATPVI